MYLCTFVYLYTYIHNSTYIVLYMQCYHKMPTTILRISLSLPQGFLSLLVPLNTLGSQFY